MEWAECIEDAYIGREKITFGEPAKRISIINERFTTNKQQEHCGKRVSPKVFSFFNKTPSNEALH
jgi:hypothetical protein